MIGTKAAFATWLPARGLSLAAGVDTEPALLSASAQLAAMCRRRLEPLADQTQTVYGHGGDLLPLPEEMAAITSVSVAGSNWGASCWAAQPAAAPHVSLRALLGLVWPEDLAVTVTGTLGYQTTVPADLVEACYLLASGDLLAPQNGLSRVTVINVTVEYSVAQAQEKVLALVAPHVKHPGL